MVKTEELPYSNALRIAKGLLLGLKTFYRCNVPIVEPSKSISNVSPFLTTVNYSSYKDIKIRTTFGNNGTETFFQCCPNHIYKFIWKNRCFLIAFFDSPKAYSYYSTLPNSGEKNSVFCSLIELKDSTHKKHEMNFTFDTKTKTFLELFDIDSYISDSIIKECYDTNGVELQLRGNVLF